jgi:GDPmannose 4,6-dehydratase
MLQHDRADDYVLATGKTNSIEDLLDAAFHVVDLDWREYVKQDDRYRRPAEVSQLAGDASKAESELGWKAKSLLPQIAEQMVHSDLERLKAN